MNCPVFIPHSLFLRFALSRISGLILFQAHACSLADIGTDADAKALCLTLDAGQGAAESGLDVFFIHSELSLTGMQLVDEARCDLIVCDEDEDDPLR
jgi:hypothetical protein